MLTKTKKEKRKKKKKQPSKAEKLMKIVKVILVVEASLFNRTNQIAIIDAHMTRSSCGSLNFEACEGT